MASMVEISASGVLEKISQGHLQCPICTCRFINPKILNCLHSFCQRCLEFMVEGHSQQGEITCPLCRQQTALSEAGVAGLSNNFSLTALVDEVTQQEELVKSQSSKIICEVCEEDEAIARCLECREYLCDVCHNAHGRGKKTRNHEMASINELRSGKKPYQSRLRNKIPKCPKHSSQDLYFFCKTCETLICAACTALDHKAPDHILSDIPKATALCKEKLDGLEGKAKQQLATLKDGKATAENSYTNHKVRAKEILSTISTKADEEVAKIRKVEQLLKNHHSQLFEKKDKEFEDVMVKYRNSVEKIESTMENVQTVRSQANDYDLLRHQQKVLQNLQLATKISIPEPVEGLAHEDGQQRKIITVSDSAEPSSVTYAQLQKYSHLIMGTEEPKVSPGKCITCSQPLNAKASSPEAKAPPVLKAPPLRQYTPQTCCIPTMNLHDQARRMQIGTRVIRGPHWSRGNEDQPEGRVTWIDIEEGLVSVEWASGDEFENYHMGAKGEYELQMVKYAYGYQS